MAGQFVYAVVHDGTGKFLLAHKNQKGFFFFNDREQRGKIVPGGQVLHGAGDYALPGGARGQNESVVAGAKREFAEETNFDISGLQATPNYFTGTQGRNTYYGVYVQASGLSDICTPVQAHLDAGTQAALAVQAGTYGKGDYDRMRREHPGCPKDNELDSIDIWDVTNPNNWAQIENFKNSQDTDWFYHILLHLKESL
ncbi:MAG: NUDIX hydrolase [Persicimonas sp.]